MDQPARETSSLSTPDVEQGKRGQLRIRERRCQRGVRDTHTDSIWDHRSRTKEDPETQARDKLKPRHCRGNQPRL